MITHLSIFKRLRDFVVALILGATMITAPSHAGEKVSNVSILTSLAPEALFDALTLTPPENMDAVDRQLASYTRQVPEMEILRLYGRGGLNMLQMLPRFLGEAPSSVDYEHDASVRDVLMQLQMQRIETMLREGMPSATLFKVGNGSQFDHPYVCVITLDAEFFRRSPESVLALMTPNFNEASSSTTAMPAMNVEDFLKFTVDHEMFHCLDAYFNGPTIQKTQDALKQHYQEYTNEARADAFASMAFMLEREQSSDFLEAFAAMRTLALLDMDLAHYTSDVITASMEASMLGDVESTQMRVAVSHLLASMATPTFEGFAMRIASAAQLVGRLGGDPSDMLNEIADQNLPNATDDTVATLHEALENAKYTLAAIYGQNTGNVSMPDMQSTEALQ